MRYYTYLWIKNDNKRNEIKKLILDNNLFLKNGAMKKLVDKSIVLNSIDAICLIKDGNKPIGWASIMTGFSDRPHKDVLPSYPHLGVFVLPKYRGNGYASKAVTNLLKLFYKKSILKEYSFKEIHYSDPKIFFEPLLGKKNKFYTKGIGIQTISLEF